MRVCSVAGCDRVEKARSLCGAHYMRLRTSGDIRADVPVKSWKYDEQCSVADCDRPARVNGMCRAHNKRVWKSGDAKPDRPINGSIKVCAIEGCTSGVNAKLMCAKHYRKLRVYDITADEVARLEAGRITCEICGEVATDVDHCHASGKVRGFLCNPCNRALAAVRDRPEILLAAAAYLKRN